eukprot:m.129736 g.129736  ORF g.129736 m.129736 type:complete len:1285 (-) comp9464_c0_seq1:2134-5988(-)
MDVPFQLQLSSPLLQIWSSQSYLQTMTSLNSTILPRGFSALDPNSLHLSVSTSSSHSSSNSTTTTRNFIASPSLVDASDQPSKLNSVHPPNKHSDLLSISHNGEIEGTPTLHFRLNSVNDADCVMSEWIPLPTCFDFTSGLRLSPNLTLPLLDENIVQPFVRFVLRPRDVAGYGRDCPRYDSESIASSRINLSSTLRSAFGEFVTPSSTYGQMAIGALFTLKFEMGCTTNTSGSFVDAIVNMMTSPTSSTQSSDAGSKFNSLLQHLKLNSVLSDLSYRNGFVRQNKLLDNWLVNGQSPETPSSLHDVVARNILFSSGVGNVLAILSQGRISQRSLPMPSSLAELENFLAARGLLASSTSFVDVNDGSWVACASSSPGTKGCTIQVTSSSSPTRESLVFSPPPTTTKGGENSNFAYDFVLPSGEHQLELVGSDSSGKVVEYACVQLLLGSASKNNIVGRSPLVTPSDITQLMKVSTSTISSLAWLGVPSSSSSSTRASLFLSNANRFRFANAAPKTGMLDPFVFDEHSCIFPSDMPPSKTSDSTLGDMLCDDFVFAPTAITSMWGDPHHDSPTTALKEYVGAKLLSLSQGFPSLLVAPSANRVSNHSTSLLLVHTRSSGGTLYYPVPPLVVEPGALQYMVDGEASESFFVAFPRSNLVQSNTVGDLVVGCSEEARFLICRVNGGDLFPCDAVFDRVNDWYSVSLDLKEGLNEVEIGCVDFAGNVPPRFSSISITRDSTSPAIRFSQLPGTCSVGGVGGDELGNFLSYGPSCIVGSGNGRSTKDGEYVIGVSAGDEQTSFQCRVIQLQEESTGDGISARVLSGSAFEEDVVLTSPPLVAMLREKGMLPSQACCWALFEGNTACAEECVLGVWDPFTSSVCLGGSQLDRLDGLIEYSQCTQASLRELVVSFSRLSSDPFSDISVGQGGSGGWVDCSEVTTIKTSGNFKASSGVLVLQGTLAQPNGTVNIIQVVASDEAGNSVPGTDAPFLTVLHDPQSFPVNELYSLRQSVSASLLSCLPVSSTLVVVMVIGCLLFILTLAYLMYLWLTWDMYISRQLLKASVLVPSQKREKEALQQAYEMIHISDMTVDFGAEPTFFDENEDALDDNTDFLRSLGLFGDLLEEEAFLKEESNVDDAAPFEPEEDHQLVMEGRVDSDGDVEHDLDSTVNDESELPFDEKALMQEYEEHMQRAGELSPFEVEVDLDDEPGDAMAVISDMLDGRIDLDILDEEDEEEDTGDARHANKHQMTKQEKRLSSQVDEAARGLFDLSLDNSFTSQRVTIETTSW